MEEWISGNVRLNLYNTPVDVEISVPAKPVKLRRMLPIFQAMTNFVVETTAGVTEAQGAEISCKAGCGACCRQVVPVMQTEIYELQEVIENMPEPKRSEVRARFERACERLHETGWLKRLGNFLQHTDEERVELAGEYFREQIPCPFLENESCSIHPNRPLVCREYLVVSPAEYCSAPTPETIDRLVLPMQLSAKVAKIGYLPGQPAPPFVPLVQILELAENKPEQATEKSGPEWMNEFFNILQA